MHVGPSVEHTLSRLRSVGQGTPYNVWLDTCDFYTTLPEYVLVVDTQVFVCVAVINYCIAIIMACANSR